MKRYIFLSVFFVLGISQAYAGPHWEVKTYKSQGRNASGYYGFYFDRSAQERCQQEEAVVLDVLYLAARDVQVRCQVTNKNIGGITYEKIWVLEGTFRVLVE